MWDFTHTCKPNNAYIGERERERERIFFSSYMIEQLKQTNFPLE